MLQHITSQDIRAYGLIPEICGRFPVVTYMTKLDEDALKRILLEPKNALTQQYQKLLEIDDIHLTFDDEAISAIVENGRVKIRRQRITHHHRKIMTDAMFDFPGKTRKNYISPKHT